VLTAAMGVQACREQNPANEKIVPPGASSDPVLKYFNHWSDKDGFSLNVPSGWGVSKIGTNLLCFRDQTSYRTIGVLELGTLAGAAPQLVAQTADWQKAAGLTSFQNLGVTDMGLPEGGASLEYTYQDASGHLMHGVNELLRFSGRLFLVCVVTTDSAWLTDRDGFSATQSSFVYPGK
jgi:hypothetical protein